MDDLRHAKSSFYMKQLGFCSRTQQERVATKRERAFRSCSCVPWIIMRLSPCHIVILNIQLLTASTIVVRENSCKLFDEEISPVLMILEILQQHCMPKWKSRFWYLLRQGFWQHEWDRYTICKGPGTIDGLHCIASSTCLLSISLRGTECWRRFDISEIETHAKSLYFTWCLDHHSPYAAHIQLSHRRAGYHMRAVAIREPSGDVHILEGCLSLTFFTWEISSGTQCIV